MKQRSFMLKKIETFLAKNGWEKIYDKPPDGHQTWEKYEPDLGFWEMFIDYREDGRHCCELWCGNGATKPEAVFSLRSVRAVLRRRGLAI